MADIEVSTARAALHVGLLESLRGLEAIGDYAAAAHLAAAIDVLEDGGGLGMAARPGDHGGHPIAAMAHSMTERFGAQAADVARRQLDRAHGPALLAWAAIVNRIGG